MIADLHCHSTASDGELDPASLLTMAQEHHVQLLALTDHDTVAGVEALQGLEAGACRLINGVEISTTWHKQSVHIVGLDFDLQSPDLRDALETQRQRRIDRAIDIGEKLARLGIHGAYEGATGLAASEAPCRPHFAQWLVQQEHCADVAQAFKKYLAGKAMAGVNQCWPSVEQVVAWIVDSGGIAVLAHPEDYGLTRSKLRRLLRDFQAAGGLAMELAAPGKADNTALMIESLCAEYGLCASVGSDYHNANQRWRKLGKTRAMPPSLEPVWERFR